MNSDEPPTIDRDPTGPLPIIDRDPTEEVVVNEAPGVDLDELPAVAKGVLLYAHVGADAAQGVLSRRLIGQRMTGERWPIGFTDLDALDDIAEAYQAAQAGSPEQAELQAAWEAERTRQRWVMAARWFVFAVALVAAVVLVLVQVDQHGMWPLIFLSIGVPLALAAAGWLIERRAARHNRAAVAAAERLADEPDALPPGRPVDVDKPGRRQIPARRRLLRVIDGAGQGDAGDEDLDDVDEAAPVWTLPPMTLLTRSRYQEADARTIAEQGELLAAALETYDVEAHLVGTVTGPTITRFELELGPGVKVAKITNLNRDIAYAMASADVRILAPIPGKKAIGVEVPNVERQIVTLADVLTTQKAQLAPHPLEVAVGRDIAGRPVTMNLAKAPHLLIAGATGAGKSSCINSLITSILMRCTPDQVRMLLVDPKRVELGQYNHLPHLLTPVVTNPKKAANALAWVVKEMDHRYDVLAEAGVRDITGYNKDAPKPLPYILVVVDELNDLMMVAARDVEESICRIAQMARAVGIHLVIATQRPSVNVITGVIKANVPARLAFNVSSAADSRVILDQGGAERLIGKGDLLLLGPSSSVPQRIQGCWVSEDEVRAVTKAWRAQATTVSYEDTTVLGDEDNAPTPAPVLTAVVEDIPGEAEDDELLVEAMELVVHSQLGSTSMLQRKLRIGFARAGRLMNLLEQQGVVGPDQGEARARAVLMTPDELDGELDGAPTSDDAPAGGTETDNDEPVDLDPLRRIVEIVQFLDAGDGIPLAADVATHLARKWPEHRSVDSVAALNKLLDDYQLKTVQPRTQLKQPGRKLLHCVRRSTVEDRLEELEQR
jgi:DNA segregation ATPase FtsK/SpoIIIE-like protein